jgi:hypothetical protein
MTLSPSARAIDKRDKAIANARSEYAATLVAIAALEDLLAKESSGTAVSFCRLWALAQPVAPGTGRLLSETSQHVPRQTTTQTSPPRHPGYARLAFRAADTPPRLLPPDLARRH